MEKRHPCGASFCFAWVVRNFAFGEYTSSLRLVSELPDLRDGYAKANLMLCIKSCSMRVISTNRKEASLRCLFSIGGDDGNRTRVQKPLDITFSVGSLSFEISRFPTPTNRLRGLVALLCMTDTSANSRCMFTTDLTHGGSRSPHPRYGWLKSHVTAYAARATVLLSFIF